MKLHELLAVESAHETQAAKCAAELSDTFQKKRHHFEEKRIVFFPNGEGQSAVTETQSDIQTTVSTELTWIGGFIKKSWDASYQVAEANTKARADIVLEDGTTLAKDIPATALLELEKRVTQLQNLLTNIPTLDPTKGFKADSQRGKGIYQAREISKPRTKKEKKVIVKYEATKEHPAQTEILDQDTTVGRIQEQEWSSLITPAEKADLLGRVEILGRAVRRARSRANEVDVDKDAQIASNLLKYVFGGVTSGV